MVLHGAGNNLGGGGGVAVYQDDERDVVALVAAHGVVATLCGGAAMVRDDELILVEEHIADGYCFVEQAAGVAAHVEKQAIEGWRIKLLQGVGNFAIGGFVKAGKANVTDARFQQKGDVHGMARNFVARYGEDERLGVAFAGNRNFYDRALGTLQHVGDIAGGEAVGGLVINLDNNVAGANAGVIGRSADVGSHDHGVVLSRGNDHAYAVVFTALIFAQEGKLASIKEIRVGVQHAKHTGYGALVDGLVDVDRLGVIGLHDVQNTRKVVDGALVIVRRGRGGPDIRPVNPA